MITVARSLGGEVLYEVLGHLDLGRDAASLYDSNRPVRPWTKDLLAAYLVAPGRLFIHALPLITADFPSMVEALRIGRFSALRDPASTSLAVRLAEVLAAEFPRVEARWTQDAVAARERAVELVAWFPSLVRIRAALWAETGATPPALEILDCDALRARNATRGRGCAAFGRRRVAVSLGAPMEQVVCQIVHEEMHPVTDRAVRAAFAGTSQDTRVGGAGFALHRELERAAVEAGDRIITLVAPELVPGYRRWLEQNWRA